MTGAERFLAACRGEPIDATPVWFMRQAGGQLPGYLALRERYSVLDIATTPELCAEVSAGAATTLGTDGAVMYADIMLLVQAMGVPLELASTGPVLGRTIRTDADVAGLRTPDPATDLGHVLAAIGIVRRELAGRAAVIGIAGGPFTLGAYLVEGGPSRDQLLARALILGAPHTWHTLMERLTAATVDYAVAQVGAGADAIALFDTWAASLTETEYRAAVLPYSQRIIAAVRGAGGHVIHSMARSAPLLDAIADLGAGVIAIDSRQPIALARRRLGAGQPVQGNLDPARLLAGWASIETGARDVLDAVGGAPGHLFNTGEAIPRETDPALLRDLVSLVHDITAGARRPTEEPVHA